MTIKMLEDLVSSQNKTIKGLKIAVIILFILFAFMVAFVLSNYEIVYEEVYEEKDYEIEQEVDNGGNNTAIVDSKVDISSPLLMVCGSAIIISIIIVGGLVIYGKTKNHN